MKQELGEPSFFSRPLVLWLMTASIGWYAGDGYGWIIGIGIAVAFLICVLLNNITILSRSGSLVWTTRLRVIIYIGFMLVIALARAEICELGRCTSLMG